MLDSRQLGLVCNGKEALSRLEQLNLKRFELVILPDEDEPAARQAAAREEFSFGIHAPLFRGAEYHEYALLAALVDPDPWRREQAQLFFSRELQQAASWGAEYLVAHIQRPVLMNGESEGADWDEAAAVEIAIEMAAALTHEARELALELHLENMMGSPAFYSPNAYAQLFEAVPEARLCLDIGHLAIDAVHFGFDLLAAAERLAPYVGSLHIYNNQIGEFDFAALRESGLLRKIPVHPSRSPGHDWIPVGKLLRQVLAANPAALLTFEVYFRMESSPQQTREGVEWVADKLSKMQATA